MTHFTNYRVIGLLTLLILTNKLFGQNPISPPGIYIADPEAHVWKDGRVYVYGSVDESVDYPCSHTHHVLSTDDMINWTLHEDYFKSKGLSDNVPYSDQILFAPGVTFKDGKYYLYYCITEPNQLEGVAVSDDPVKGYSQGKPINLFGYNQIDPAAFVDDDGTSYYLWGQFNLKIAKLNDDMASLDSTSIIDDLLTEKEHRFHEGAYMMKRNGLYYLIYAHLSNAHRPTQIGYATSQNPMGPYKYGGIIIDNDHSDINVWNNHGSVIEYNDQWYVFYHRSTHASHRMRKACVEPIFFDEMGDIAEVLMTTQGAGPPLNPFDKLDAARACILHGNVRIEGLGQSNEILTKMVNKDRALYRYLQFTGKEKTINIRGRLKGAGAKILIKQDGPWNPPIAEIEITSENGEWDTFSADVNAIEGKHALWVVFSAQAENELSVDWIQFE